jgi:uncharacterized membrane-anchored protein YhcB (DUF1043 family)
MSDKNTISRRSFLKGLGATATVAATGVPIKTGPDKLTTMSNAVKSLHTKSNLLGNQLTALNQNYSRGFAGGYSAFLADMVEKKEITKAFADKARKLVNNSEERAKLRLEIKQKQDKVWEQREKKLSSLRDYASKNHPSVFIMGSGDVKNLEKGQKLEGYRSNTNIPVISTPEGRNKKKNTKPKVKGGGGSRGEDGIIRGLGSDLDAIFTRNRFGNTDYRKGGLFRKNK